MDQHHLLLSLSLRLNANQLMLCERRVKRSINSSGLCKGTQTEALAFPAVMNLSTPPACSPGQLAACSPPQSPFPALSEQSTNALLMVIFRFSWYNEKGSQWLKTLSNLCIYIHPKQPQAQHVIFTTTEKVSRRQSRFCSVKRLRTTVWGLIQRTGQICVIVRKHELLYVIRHLQL